jgi:protein-L-isoaspartate(D-aspartate) O-methyltransferase
MIASMPDFERQRLEMVSRQIEERGIRESRLLQALRSVPRHAFVPSEVQGYAYEDRPLPIGEGQTISQPYIVALMTFLLHLKGTENVLEIGSGSGYQAAILALLARQVHSIERDPLLAERAKKALCDLGYLNAVIYTGDGSSGLPESGPYDGILVTAAAPAVPRPLLEQLAPEGRLVLPVGGHNGQQLQVWWPTNTGFDYDEIAPVAFVPLRGHWGWSETDWDWSKE